jgi:hypothetical protein
MTVLWSTDLLFSAITVSSIVAEKLVSWQVLVRVVETPGRGYERGRKQKEDHFRRGRELVVAVSDQLEETRGVVNLARVGEDRVY